MNLNEYIQLLDYPTKKIIANKNWHMIKHGNLPEQQFNDIFSSFSVLEPHLIDFDRYLHEQDFKTFSHLLSLVGKDNQILNNIFDHFIDKSLMYSCNSSEEKIADLFYEKFNNPLTEKFITKHYVPLPDTEHPILDRAKKIMAMSFSEPSCFINFVELFKDDKSLFLLEHNAENIFRHVSKNTVINQQLEIWHKKHDTENVLNNYRSYRASSVKNQKFLQSLINDITLIRKQVVEYFIQFPDKYVEYGDKKLPPAFLFYTPLYTKEHNIQLEKKHIDIYLQHSKNTKYDYFVEKFFHLKDTDENVQQYFSSIFDKNLPLEEMLSKLNHISIRIIDNNDNICETHLKKLYQYNDNLKDLYLEYRKKRLEFLLNDEKTRTNKFKL